MQTRKLLQRFSLLSLAFSSIFLMDMALPTVQESAKITSIYRPKTKYNRVSEEEVMVKTTKGFIKTSPHLLYQVAVGDSAYFSKSMILRIGKSIYLKKQDRLVPSGNFLYSWFIFMPVLILVTSVLTIKTKNERIIENMGGANIALTIFVLIILLKDHFR